MSKAELLRENFIKRFGREPRMFSAPGRTELGGNHTDHQKGCVLAAAVSMEAVCAAAENGSDLVNIISEGYEPSALSITQLEPIESEKGSHVSLVRGILAGFAGLGFELSGFDIMISSDVLPGSGLSSSAAFEVLTACAVNALFCGGKLRPMDIALISQRAENEYFGKPCGLMDQAACALGGIVAIDFANDVPAVRRINLDLEEYGYALCIIDCGAGHEDLTGEYAAITQEMGSLAGHFGEKVLSRVDFPEFMATLPLLREKYGDRAVLRGLHFFAESQRAQCQALALEVGDIEVFIDYVNQSGRSSFMYLQNIYPGGSTRHQELALTLSLCDMLLGGKGAFRVHGGGFAGTAQCFVPLYMLEDFKNNIENLLGPGVCHILQISPLGCREIRVKE